MSGTNGTAAVVAENGVLTLPDSGKTIQTCRVPVMLVRDIQRSVKRPVPPTLEVQYEAGVRREENRNDPAYLEALNEYGMELGERLLKLVIRRGVIVTVDTDAVAALRADLAEMGVTLDADDHFVYVSRILCETERDLEALREAVLRRSQPTEAATAEAVERFPGDVSR